MSTTTHSTTLSSHDIDEIDQIFVDMRRGLGLTRNSEAAEAIARRIVNCYQGGDRESGALQHIIDYYKSAALRQTPAQNKTEAINRWENEGGALARLPHERLLAWPAPLHS
ncbi:hypothetical protein JVX98_03855 (plasmid) [Ensifer sp. PDNC004]|uniref:hypothetical protein n=1 Tax=Ensifer sp. PDNC004 TaxID=2811423 RepID=UPI001962B8FB|nr:hypothetical protein [Ensifer sp. PDNC004]QRY66366.1 hypothetical protein JVX98_03855 [Ensifer sp. PDNC004]